MNDQTPSPSRRSILTTAAWTVPAITLAAAAPAFADSTPPIRLDPGINGWVLVTYGTTYGFDATFDSDPAGTDPASPDGAPFGLYVYDAVTDGVQVPLGGASITLWFRGVVGRWTYGSRNSNPNGGGHGSGWSSPVSVGTRTQPDGLTYYGYRFDYSGGYVPQGDGRVYLQDFEATAKNVASGDATFWVERKIVVDGDLLTFQRRNGERGSMGDGFPVGTSRARSFAHPSGLTGVMV